MIPLRVILPNELLDSAPKGSFTEQDQVPDALVSHALHPAFSEGVQVGGSRRQPHRSHASGLDRRPERGRAVSVRNHFTPPLPKLNPDKSLLPDPTSDEYLNPTGSPWGIIIRQMLLPSDPTASHFKPRTLATQYDHIRIAILAILTGLALALPLGAQQPDLDDQLRLAYARLSAEDPAEREAASQSLIQFGKSAVDYLKRKSIAETDPEVLGRIKIILDSIELDSVRKIEWALTWETRPVAPEAEVEVSKPVWCAEGILVSAQSHSILMGTLGNVERRSQSGRFRVANGALVDLDKIAVPKTIEPIWAPDGSACLWRDESGCYVQKGVNLELRQEVALPYTGIGFLALSDRGGYVAVSDLENPSELTTIDLRDGSTNQRLTLEGRIESMFYLRESTTLAVCIRAHDSFLLNTIRADGKVFSLIPIEGGTPLRQKPHLGRWIAFVDQEHHVQLLDARQEFESITFSLPPGATSISQILLKESRDRLVISCSNLAKYFLLSRAESQPVELGDVPGIDGSLGTLDDGTLVLLLTEGAALYGPSNWHHACTKGEMQGRWLTVSPSGTAMAISGLNRVSVFTHK